MAKELLKMDENKESYVQLKHLIIYCDLFEQLPQVTTARMEAML